MMHSESLERKSARYSLLDVVVVVVFVDVAVVYLLFVGCLCHTTHMGQRIMR